MKQNPHFPDSPGCSRRHSSSCHSGLWAALLSHSPSAGGDLEMATGSSPLPVLPPVLVPAFPDKQPVIDLHVLRHINWYL